MASPSSFFIRLPDSQAIRRAGGRTEGDGKVKDETTPEHASDGLDSGHFECICGCCLGGCDLRAGIALVVGQAGSRMRLLAGLGLARGKIDAESSGCGQLSMNMIMRTWPISKHFFKEYIA